MTDESGVPRSCAICSAEEWHEYQRQKKEREATGGESAREVPSMEPSAPPAQPEPKRFSRFRAEKTSHGFWRVGDVVYVTQAEAEKVALEARSKRFGVMVVAVLFGFVALGVTQCTSYLANREPSPAERAGMNEIKLNRVAREMVQAQLKDPSSAQFRSQRGLCGEVNSKNSFGAYGGYQRFIAAGQGMVAFETALPADVFRGLWAEACNG